ncbi:MAG: S24/S26 family peptidase [Acidiferrobacteraceae bacterium]
MSIAGIPREAAPLRRVGPRASAYRRLGRGVAPLALLVGAGLYGLRINLTPSEPIGVWHLHRGAPRMGDFVTLCPPLTRPYPFLERGTCPDSRYRS